MEICNGALRPVQKYPSLNNHRDLMETLDRVIRLNAINYNVGIQFTVTEPNDEDQLEVLCDDHSGFEIGDSFIVDGWEFERRGKEKTDKNKYGIAMNCALYLMDALLDASGGLVAIHWDAVVFYDSKTKTCGFHLYDDEDWGITVVVIPHLNVGNTETIH